VDVPKNRRQGKNTLINVLTPDSKEINMPVFQKRMKRVNNCTATSWKCAYCHPKKRWKCFQNTVRSFQLEALQKYGDTPQMKKAIDERLKEQKRQRATEILGVDKKEDE